MHSRSPVDTNLGILLGESYNGICALADLFAVVKIPNKLSGTVAGERLLYLSSYLVGPRTLSFQNKKTLIFCFSLLLSSILIPNIMEHQSILSFSAPKGELLEPPQSEHPILASSYELRPDPLWFRSYPSLVRSRKPLPSSAGVRASVLMSCHRRHVT